MNRRIALLASLVTISAIQAHDVTTPVVTNQGLISRTVDTLVYPFVWTKDTAVATADFLTVNTLGLVTGTSYLKDGLLDRNKLAIGRIAFLAATIVAAQKAYNWYLAQQEAKDNADFIDFTYNDQN